MTRPTHKELKAKLLSKPSVAKEYDSMEEEYQLLREMINARKQMNLTQEKVAIAMGTTTSAVSRLESLNSQNSPSPSFKTLKKYAHALNCTLSVRLTPNKRKAKK